MELKSEIIILSDRVILNIIAENPYELLEKMKSYFEANGNIFPLSGRTLLITENQGIELDRNVFKTLFQIPMLTITISDGNVGAEFASIKVNPEEVFNLI